MRKWGVNLGLTVFAQFIDHLPAYEVQKCVALYRGDAHLRAVLFVLDQYLADCNSCYSVGVARYRAMERQIAAVPVSTDVCETFPMIERDA